MTRHTFTCDICKVDVTDTSTKGIHYCPNCGCDMRWNLDGLQIVEDTYIRTKWSDSLAISPDQISEHKQLFPDVKVNAQGQIGFDCVSQHDKYLTATGFIKHPQKIKRKGTKVA